MTLGNDGLRVFSALRRGAAFVVLVFATAATLVSPVLAGSEQAELTSTRTELKGPASARYSQRAKFTATVYSSAPTGTVHLKEGATLLDTGELQILDDFSGGVSAGFDHSCAVTGNGGAKCWGYNRYGQLGDGTTTNRPWPVAVQGLPSEIRAIETGGGHTCAVAHGGDVYCWGVGGSGQLGDGTLESSLVPVSVNGLPTDVTAIAAGHAHTCALSKDGAVLCWGWNKYGQLGDGTTVDKRTPTMVQGLSSGVVAISIHYEHSCALADSGLVLCWGRNLGGQLGNGTTKDALTPSAVDGLPSDIAAISAGDSQTCALDDKGGAYCWGNNSWGQLGDGTKTRRLRPVAVQGLQSEITAIATGNIHTCARTVAGGVQCWGDNGVGQLGNGTRFDSLSPVDVVNLSDAVSLSLTENTTCVIRRNGALACWGDNRNNQIGDGSEIIRDTPTIPVGFGDRTAFLPSAAKLRTDDLPVGTHRLKAKFLGDDYNGASRSSAVDLEIRKGFSKIKWIRAEPPVGNAVVGRITAKVDPASPSRGMPIGKVRFKVGSTVLGTAALTDGKASLDWVWPASGSHVVKATFLGDSNWKKSSGARTFQIK